MARAFDAHRNLRLAADLDQAFQAACRTAGVGASEMLRTLIAEWVLSVHESDDEGRAGDAASEPQANDREGRRKVGVS